MSRFAACIVLTITVLFAKSQVPFSAAGTGTPTTVVVPGTIQLTITWSPTVCSYANGSITVSATGGTAPYQFSADGVTFQSNGHFTGLYNGTYSVVVRDAAGQQNSTSITLNLAGTTTMLAIAAYVKPTGCATADGSMTLEGYNPYGEAPPFLYSMDGVNYQSGNTFSNLSAGNYTFFVKDAAGCIDTAYYPLFPVCAIQAVWDYSAVACTNEGHITISSVTGGTGPYTYSLNGGIFQTSPNFPGLSAGTYRLTIKDATGQTMLYTIPIFQACTLNAAAVPTDASCGNSDGTITVSQTGGTAPYTYSIDGTHFQSGNVFSGLAPGVYNITVDDAGGLQTSTGANIYNNCPSRVTATVTNTTCGGINGQIVATVINGTAPFTYSIDGVNYQSSNTFTFLPKGTYTVTAIDATGLKMTTIATVGANPEIIPNVYALPASCSYDDGVIIITAPGPGPYQYSLDGIDFQSSNVFTNVPASDLTYVYLKDPYGCVTENTRDWVNSDCIIITALQVSAVATNATCGKNDGSILVTVTNGSPPYQFSLDGINFITIGEFDGLAPGPYTITVKDANNGTAQVGANVSNIAGPVLTAGASAATCQNNDGAILVAVNGGTAPFVYAVVQNGVPSGSLNELSTGTYQVTVTDANGCVGATMATVPLVNNLTVQVGSVQPVCEGATLSLNATSAATSFSWSPSAGLSDAALPNPVLTASTTQQYTVTASEGPCQATGSVIVTVLPAPVVTVTPDTTVCYGKSVSLSGGGGGTYSWTPATYLNNPQIATPTVVDPTNTITYQLSVTGANGCISLSPASVTVTVSAPAKIFAGDDTTVAIGQPLQLQAIDVNKTGFTDYSWSPADGLNNPAIADPIAVLQNDETYTVTAYSDAGCEGSGVIRVKVYAGPNIYVPNAFTPNGDGHNDILRAIPVGISQFRYFRVYNRYGQLVFSTSDPARGWDGYMAGKQQGTATFVWQAAGVDYQGRLVERQGTVVLVR